MSWIPVQLSLPPYDHDVLVSCGTQIGLCRREWTDVDGEHWVLVDSSSNDEFTAVTHWMELPTLPETGKEGAIREPGGA